MTADHTRCIVWSNPGREVPAELMSLLASRPGVIMEHTTCGYMALARVLERSVASAGRASQPGAAVDGAPVRVPTVLLMIEPTELELAALTHDAAQRFAPHAACWQYEARATPAMRPVREADPRRWTRQSAVDEGEGSRRAAGFVPGHAVRTGPASVQPVIA